LVEVEKLRFLLAQEVPGLGKGHLHLAVRAFAHLGDLGMDLLLLLLVGVPKILSLLRALAGSIAKQLGAILHEDVVCAAVAHSWMRLDLVSDRLPLALLAFAVGAYYHPCR
jgi:hypothetical protein